MVGVWRRSCWTLLYWLVEGRSGVTEIKGEKKKETRERKRDVRVRVLGGVGWWR